MGQLVLSTLISEVRSGLQGRDDTSDEQIVISLNAAQNYLSRFHNWQELKRTANAKTGTNGNAILGTALTGDPELEQYLPTPDRLKKVHSLIIVDGTSSVKLRERPWRQLDKLYPNPVASSRRRPYFYSRWGERFQLYPVPDLVYRVKMKYTRDPTPFDISAPNQFSDFDAKDDIIIDIALSHRWARYGRHDKSDEFYKRAADQLKVAAKDDNQFPDMSTHPDEGFDEDAPTGDYWANPFVMRVT